MEEIRNLMQEMQTIESRIQNLLDQEQKKIVHVSDVDVLYSEWGCTVQNNIDILQSALRDMEGVRLTLDCYEEGSK